MDKAALLVDHYQKSYELTHELWKERNRLFLTLLAVIGIAALLTYKVSESQTLFIGLLVNLLNIDTQPTRLDQFQQNFPFDILQIILLLVILYLMINLYQRTVYITRNYSYLAQIETEIRDELGLKGKVLFTREGEFYKSNQTFIQRWLVRVVYMVALGGLLLAFLLKRISDDWAVNQGLALVEIVIALVIAAFFVAYALPLVKPEMK